MTKFYGGFWLRFVAAIIDTVIILCIAAGINSILGVPTTFSGQSSNIPIRDIIFANLFSFTAGFLYYSIIQGMMKGSIGKHAMGLTLVDAKSFKQVSIGQSVGRYTMSSVSYLVFGIGILSIGWNKKKQSWHDRVAGTVIVKKKHLKQLSAPKIKKKVAPVIQESKAA